MTSGNNITTRIAEHRKDYQTSTPAGVTTRASHQGSVVRIHKSAIMDHMVQQNHLPNWNNVKVLSQDTDNATRRIREAIWIRQKPSLNWDKGAYHPSHLYDDLLSPNKRRGGGPKTPVSNTLAQTTPPTQLHNQSKQNKDPDMRSGTPCKGNYLDLLLKETY